MTSVTLPNTLLSVGENPFFGCSQLTSILVESGSPLFASSGGVLYSLDGTFLASFPPGRSGSFTVPATVTAIGPSAFSSSLITSVTLPNGLLSIGNGAFYATPLTTIIIPATVTSLGDTVFYACPSLATVYVLPVLPPSLGGDQVFDSTPGGLQILVPTGTLFLYENASRWSEYAAKIEES
jgi:hypothetical protein